MRAPRVHAKATFSPNPLHVILVEDLEHQAEAGFQFVLPLEKHGRWAGNDDFPSFLAEKQLTCNQRRLDGLAETHVVGNEKVHPRQQKCLLQGLQLVGVEMNAGSKWGLKQLGVGRRYAVPAKRIQ